MVGIIVALDGEAEKVIERTENKKYFTLCGKKAVSGILFGKETVLIISGVGKVNAALSCQALIDRFSPECIINFGTAGGADESVEIFSYYLIGKACQYDFDVTDIDDVPVGYMEWYDRIFFDCRINKIKGFQVKNLATADRFSNRKQDIDTVKKLQCSLRDMEGGAIAEVCTSNDIPLIMLKGVTDIYDKPAAQYYENNMKVRAGFPDELEKIFGAL